MTEREAVCCRCDGEHLDSQYHASGGKDRWLENGPFAAALPKDVQKGLAGFLGVESITTLEDVFAAFPGGFSEGTLTIDDLCLSTEQTPHRGHLEGEQYAFRCFFDAILLAQLTESETTIRTQSPAGTEITLKATGEGTVTATPEDAAMSFGIQDGLEETDEDPTIEEAYQAICPYVRAFPSREAYDHWASAIPAATVGFSAAHGADVATLITG